MDLSQWAAYAISAIFGGAGGIAASLTKFSAAIAVLEKTMLELKHDLKVQATKMEDHQSYHDGLSQERSGDIEKLQEQIADLRKALDDSKNNHADYEASVQRSLGAIEGTVNMIARNGCARACAPSGGSPVVGPGRYSSYTGLPADGKDPRGQRR